MSNPEDRQTAGYTTGPWRVEDCELIGESTFIATLHWHSGREVQNKADAALIASAPELLKQRDDLAKALEGLRRRFHRALIASGSAEEFADAACAEADAALASLCSARVTTGEP